MHDSLLRAGASCSVIGGEGGFCCSFIGGKGRVLLFRER
ncbi:hypothetical protein MC7420_5065 [Coleofasciculus chthonoplastes PCC 7420]|uniref:Uncharacterized protein n=1 Tax=Coleofasciculus chthonoplastes PCC 7420 TaxID=118168 RepID=B4W1J7_9CYAN|nr:hypothetical protein MC7420_5065 [Coleofasciculus chthonoplastes PCC 7420]